MSSQPGGGSGMQTTGAPSAAHSEALARAQGQGPAVLQFTPTWEGAHLGGSPPGREPTWEGAHQGPF